MDPRLEDFLGFLLLGIGCSLIGFWARGFMDATRRKYKKG